MSFVKSRHVTALVEAMRAQRDKTFARGEALRRFMQRDGKKLQAPLALSPAGE